MTDHSTASDEIAVARYLEARNYVDVEVVRMEPRLRDRDGKVKVVRQFNADLGNPQAAFPSIQVAGTSGKGSVSLLLSSILSHAGLVTGLHVSPYLQVFTEKTWIDGHYCSATEIHRAYTRVRDIAEKYRYRDDCPASVHGMTSLAMSYEVFRERGLDWCVMETGVGGRFDLVQGLDRKLAVITDIGLDHTKTLGETVKEIAWHKAGVMEGCEMAVAVRDPRTWPVLEQQAQESGCRLVPIEPDHFGTLRQGERATFLTLNLGNLGRIEVPWAGSARSFKLRNSVVAAVAADALAGLGVSIGPDDVSAGLVAPPMPGRLETMQTAPRVILDGAHNAQKMAALLSSLPAPTGRSILLVGFSGERHIDELLSSFPSPPDEVFVTRPLLFGKKTVEPEYLAALLKGWSPGVHAIPNPRQAIRETLAAARTEDSVLVTGSLYLVGQVREHWYPWREVLLQRTSYPKAVK